MADLTQQQSITADWTNISTAFSMTDGKSYALDIQSSRGSVFWAVTDSADAPTADGHPWARTGGEFAVDTRSYKKEAGRHLWLRCDPAATLVCSPVD